jgi:hypothetical protein
MDLATEMDAGITIDRWRKRRGARFSDGITICGLKKRRGARFFGSDDLLYKIIVVCCGRRRRNALILPEMRVMLQNSWI